MSPQWNGSTLQTSMAISFVGSLKGVLYSMLGPDPVGLTVAV